MCKCALIVTYVIVVIFIDKSRCFLFLIFMCCLPIVFFSGRLFVCFLLTHSKICATVYEHGNEESCVTLIRMASNVCCYPEYLNLFVFLLKSVLFYINICFCANLQLETETLLGCTYQGTQPQTPYDAVCSHELSVRSDPVVARELTV